MAIEKPLKLNLGKVAQVDPANDLLAAKGLALEGSSLDTVTRSLDGNVQAPAIAGIILHKKTVPNDGKNYVVSAGHDAMFFEEFTIENELTLDGDLVGIA